MFNLCAYYCRSNGVLPLQLHVIHIALGLHSRICTWETEDSIPFPSYVEQEKHLPNRLMHIPNIEDENLVLNCGIYFFSMFL